MDIFCKWVHPPPLQVGHVWYVLCRLSRGTDTKVICIKQKDGSKLDPCLRCDLKLYFVAPDPHVYGSNKTISMTVYKVRSEPRAEPTSLVYDICQAQKGNIDVTMCYLSDLGWRVCANMLRIYLLQNIRISTKCRVLLDYRKLTSMCPCDHVLSSVTEIAQKYTEL